MNETITIDGQDYEVLTLDNPEEWTHLKTGEGKAVQIVNSIDDSFEVLLSDGSPFFFRQAAITDLGIQPLKLLERKPVEFTREAYAGHSTAFIQLPADCAGKTFLCTEVTK